MNAHNLMEDIVKKHLDEMLQERSDICTCDLCREAIMVQALNVLPAKYVTTDSGAMHALMEQVQVEQISLILKELVNAIKRVSTNPPHEKK